MSARPKVCEVHGCRKHVTHVVGVKVLFCHQVNMRGPDTPIYRERHEFRCTSHVDQDVPDKFITLPITEYDARMAKAMEARP
jgi:hypothetical protein